MSLTAAATADIASATPGADVETQSADALARTMLRAVFPELPSRCPRSPREHVRAQGRLRRMSPICPQIGRRDRLLHPGVAGRHAEEDSAEARSPHPRGAH
jgi:hypothetical protein